MFNRKRSMSLNFEEENFWKNNRILKGLTVQEAKVHCSATQNIYSADDLLPNSRITNESQLRSLSFTRNQQCCQFCSLSGKLWLLKAKYKNFSFYPRLSLWGLHLQQIFAVCAFFISFTRLCVYN
jgi:hypothetical protein